MAMEMAEPTSALDTVVERFIRPRFMLLGQIVRDLVGEEMPARQVELCVVSVIGQCVHLVHARSITSRLLPHLEYSQEELDRMADHIATFSLAALKGLSGQNGGSR
jgi:hypothetical protein